MQMSEPLQADAGQWMTDASEELPRIVGLQHEWLYVVLFLGMLNPIVVGVAILQNYGVFKLH